MRHGYSAIDVHYLHCNMLKSYRQNRATMHALQSYTVLEGDKTEKNIIQGYSLKRWRNKCDSYAVLVETSGRSQWYGFLLGVSSKLLDSKRKTLACRTVFLSSG